MISRNVLYYIDSDKRHLRKFDLSTFDAKKIQICTSGEITDLVSYDNIGSNGAIERQVPGEYSDDDDTPFADHDKSQKILCLLRDGRVVVFDVATNNSLLHIKNNDECSNPYLTIRLRISLQYNISRHIILHIIIIQHEAQDPEAVLIRNSFRHFPLC